MTPPFLHLAFVHKERHVGKKLAKSREALTVGSSDSFSGALFKRGKSSLHPIASLAILPKCSCYLSSFRKWPTGSKRGSTGGHPEASQMKISSALGVL